MTPPLPASSISQASPKEVRRAAVLGMSQETRDAWNRLVRHLTKGPMTLLGAPGPNRVLLDRARRAGALEGSLDDPGAPTRQVVIPFTGATSFQREQWKRSGHEVLDLTQPVIRRAHVSMKLFGAEGYRLVLVGHAGDPECLTITGGRRGVAIIESADEAAELPFAPRSAVFFQTSISSQRVRTVVDALQARHRDSRGEVLDTLSPAGLLREQALRNLAKETDLLLIVADPADASGRALFETARWLGSPAKIIQGAGDLDSLELRGFRCIGLSAGEYTSDEEVTWVEKQLIAR